MLDYTELKEEGGLVLWPPMEELSSINVLEGDPIHSERFDVGYFCMRTMIGSPSNWVGYRLGSSPKMFFSPYKFRYEE